MKNMSNPFKPDRFEYEQPGFLWVSPLAKRTMSSGQPVYIGGTRGSGKTSLLRTISTIDQLDSEVIRGQLSDEVLSYYSVLIRAPTMLQSLDRVDGISIENDYELISKRYKEFSLLLELHILQVACNEICRLQSKGFVKISADMFAKGAKSILKFISVNNEINAFNETPDGLEEFLTDIIMEIESHISRTSYSFHERSLRHRPGSLVTLFAKNILPSMLLDNKRDSPKQPIHFRICLDECDLLSANQQKFVNSIVRSSEFPLIWVIAFVPQKFDRSGTIFEGASLSSSDRTFQSLESVSDNDFEQLCQAVTSLRLYYSISNEYRNAHYLSFDDNLFDLKSRLGRFTLATLALNAVKKSLKRQMPGLLSYSEEITSALSSISGTGTASDLELYDDNPQIHLAYALQRLGWKIPELSDQREVDVFKAALRKKARAGFLGVCREFRVEKPPLAGHRIIVGLSDKCIRDFLKLMGAIFDVNFPNGWNDEDLHKFILDKSNIAFKTQREGIYKASNQKREDLPQIYRSNIQQGQRLIDSLGLLTHELQTSLNDKTPFSIPERGIFKIDLSSIYKTSSSSAELRKLEQLLRVARIEGYIRDVDPDAGYSLSDFDESQKVMWVRLHRMFAPYYGFSYRGALHSVGIPIKQWLEFVSEKAFSPDEWSNDVVKLLTKEENSNQQVLPFGDMQ